MERLAHLFTFISLIYGLGVANVLAHLSRLIKQGKAADWFWVHTLWSGYLLVAMASFWWVMQIWAQVPNVGYFNFMSMLFVPSLLLVMSDILFPERRVDGRVDLKEHFFAIKIPFFILFLAVQMADQLDSVQKGWEHVLELGPLYWGTQIVWYPLAFIGARSKSGRTQGVIAILALLLFVAGIINALDAV
jgi:hypothetical protein